MSDTEFKRAFRRRNKILDEAIRTEQPLKGRKKKEFEKLRKRFPLNKAEIREIERIQIKRRFGV